MLKQGNTQPCQDRAGEPTLLRAERKLEDSSLSVKIGIKPMSVNAAWKGKRFKTKEYQVYEAALIALLPKITLPDPPYRLDFTFGFSSAGSDCSNPIKLMEDILQKKYGFNDNQVYHISAQKVKVQKGSEFVEFKISSYP